MPVSLRTKPITFEELFELAKDDDGWVDTKDFTREITRHNFSLEVLDIVLGKFDATLIPETQEGSFLVHAQLRALAASYVLPQILGIISIPEYQKRFMKESVDRILKVFDGIIAWTDHFLQHGIALSLDESEGRFQTAYNEHANVIFLLLTLSDHLLHAFVASPAAIDLVINIWATKSWGQIHTNMASRGEHCKVNLLMLRVLSGSIKSRRAIRDRLKLCKDKVTPEQFLEGISERLNVMEYLLPQMVMPPDDAALHYCDLASVLAWLLSDPVFQKAVEDTDFWSVMNKGVQNILDMTGHEYAIESAVLKCIRTLIYAAIEYSSNRARNIHALLHNTNIMTTFFHIANKMFGPEPGKLTAMVLKALHMIGHCPEVADWMLYRLNTDWAESKAKLDGTWHPHVRENWNILTGQLEAASRTMDKIRGPVLRDPPFYDFGKSNRGLTDIRFCDNPWCFIPFSARKKNSRECKGCHTVIYCSELCQKMDWENLHREECREARDEYQRQISERAWYSHRTRAFHLAYLEDYYCRMLDGTKHAINPTLRINFMGGGVKITTPHPQDYTTFTERVETSMHNKQRFSDLWVEMGYAQNKLLKPPRNGSFFLYIETMYNWDNHGGALTLLVKLRAYRDSKTKKLTVQTEYSVPSVLYCID